MIDAGVIGRVSSVSSNIIGVALELGSTGFTKVGPDGVQTVGVVNSYITMPAGAHRVVAIVAAVHIRRSVDAAKLRLAITEDDTAEYYLEASIVGRFEGTGFKSGLTGYPPLHAPVRAATPTEVASLFSPGSAPSLRLGTSAIAADQDIQMDANLLLGHHCAVVGSTGSGKSCTVLGLIDSLLDHQIPSGHVVIFDTNGEYSRSFAPGTARGELTRPLVLGPTPGVASGLVLPHWFMNNEEHLALLRASEGVQAPVLQRAVADARTTSAKAGDDLICLETVQSTFAMVQQLFEQKDAQQPARMQLESLQTVITRKQADGGPCKAQWVELDALIADLLTKATLANTQWQPLSPVQKIGIATAAQTAKAIVTDALGILGMGSATAAVDFDAPVYYSLQQLCDLFLPGRVRTEQSSDNRIGAYVATLQMRLNRLLADGRYDFITRVEAHEDPLGAYLKTLMGAAPYGDATADKTWPGDENWRSQTAEHRSGPSITIFDLSLVASDVLENVTALLGRILFDFAVRSTPRANHPMLLVLEEAHRFIPSRRDSAGVSSRSTVVFERIAKEGRKFGVSLLLASQRPSELSETIVAQCGTVIAHRLSHEADQALLRHATALSSRALLDQLPGLAQQHALVTGVATGVPAAVRIRDVLDPPLSRDPDFIARWADKSALDELPAHIDAVVSDWLPAAP